MSQIHPGSVRCAIYTPLLDTGAFAVLLLRRAAGEIDAGKWELPGGSIKSTEGPLLAVSREVREETGLKGLTFIRTTKVRCPVEWRTPPTYYVTVVKRPEVVLSHEHDQFLWSSSPLKVVGLNHVSRNFLEQFRTPVAV